MIPEKTMRDAAGLPVRDGSIIGGDERAAYARAATACLLETTQRHDGVYLNPITQRMLGIWFAAVDWTCSAVRRLNGAPAELARLARFEPTGSGLHYADFPEGSMRSAAVGEYVRFEDVRAMLAAAAQHVEADGSAVQAAPLRMTNEEIDIIWQTMPGGPAAWLKGFGYSQFAKAIEDEVILNQQRELATQPAVPAVGSALVAKDEQQDQALVDLMPKRAAFLAWAKKRALDVTEDKDAWGKRKFMHSHVQALWDGWFNAPAAYASESAAAPADLSEAARDVLAERRRQVEQEGWTPEHDDEHADGQLARAGACYAMWPHATVESGWTPHQWPWARDWWKPTDERRNLVKAGALILADIERMDRATQPTGNAEQGEQS